MYAVIINPVAGNGHALAMLPAVEALLQQERIPYEVFRTKGPMDAQALARRACDAGMEAVVAMGGDGTLYEITPAMLGRDTALIVAPCGTGNDFAKALKLPMDAVSALKLQLRAPDFLIDAGRMNELFFINVSGTGFDVDVLRETEKYRGRYRGLMPYLRGLMDAIRRYRPVQAMISVDGGPMEEVRFSVFSVGNGNFIGGGMKAVPDGKVNDGCLDAVIVRPVRKALIPILLIFYIAGAHVKVGLAKTYRFKRLTLVCPGMTVNLDGELVTCDKAEYALLPGALRLRTPDPYAAG